MFLSLLFCRAGKMAGGLRTTVGCLLRGNCVGRNDLPRWANGWHGNTTDEELLILFPIRCTAMPSGGSLPLSGCGPRAAAG